MKQLILLIEDETSIRNDISRILKYSGYETIEADDGLAGYQLATKHKPDLIISDIMMNGMNGYELFSKLQDNSETATIPFLFLSARSAREDIRHGMNLGADDYLTKPFDIKELLKAVESRLKKRELNLNLISEKYSDLRQSLFKSMPHEIRTPLSTILGYSDYLIKNIEKVDSKKVEEMLGAIYEDGKRIQNLFENFMYLSKIQYILATKDEIVKLLKKRTNFAEHIVNEIANSLCIKHNKTFEIEITHKEFDILIFEEHFMKMIECLIENACKFTTKETPIRINAVFNENGNKYILTIKNFGRGITEAEKERVGAFVQFNRNIYEQQGLGLGLATVKSILQIYNGTMDIESDEISYTAIILTLPCVKKSSI